MANIFGTPEIRVTVTGVMGEGEPPCGYAVGDAWTITDYGAPAGLCTWAIAAMAPYLATLRWGGSMPWEQDKDRAVMCCSDANNPVVFELRRMAPS